MASGRRARARRGVRAIGVPAAGSAGDECDGSVESASCRSPTGRPRERAHGRPVGAGAEGHLAQDGAFGRGARSWSKFAGTVARRTSAQDQLQGCSTRSDSSGCRTPSWGHFSRLAGQVPPATPHEGDFPLRSSKFSQWVGLHWARSSHSPSPLCSNLSSYRTTLCSLVEMAQVVPHHFLLAMQPSHICSLVRTLPQRSRSAIGASQRRSSVNFTWGKLPAVGRWAQRGIRRSPGSAVGSPPPPRRRTALGVRMPGGVPGNSTHRAAICLTTWADRRGIR